MADDGGGEGVCVCVGGGGGGVRMCVCVGGDKPIFTCTIWSITA